MKSRDDILQDVFWAVRDSLWLDEDEPLAEGTTFSFLALSPTDNTFLLDLQAVWSFGPPDDITEQQRHLERIEACKTLGEFVDCMMDLYS